MEENRSLLRESVRNKKSLAELMIPDVENQRADKWCEKLGFKALSDPRGKISRRSGPRRHPLSQSPWSLQRPFPVKLQHYRDTDLCPCTIKLNERNANASREPFFRLFTEPR